jgi:hypothetical protein
MSRQRAQGRHLPHQPFEAHGLNPNSETGMVAHAARVPVWAARPNLRLTFFVRFWREKVCGTRFSASRRKPHTSGVRSPCGCAALDFDFGVRVCAGEAGCHAGESPAGRIGLFTTESWVREEAARPNPKARSRLNCPVATTVNLIE